MALLTVLTALAVGLGGVVLTGNASQLGLGGCSEPVVVSVAAAKESSGVLRDAAHALEQRKTEADGSCVDYRVHAAAPNDVARRLDSGAASDPDLWLPDSSAWLERIDGAAASPTVVAPSLARSPVVVAGRGVSRPESWLEVLSRQDVSFVDPLRSSAPAAALLALKAESPTTGLSPSEVDSVMVPLAQRIGDDGDADAPRNLTDLALDPGGAAILSEQQLLDLRAQGLGRDLDVTVPETGTLLLDYPLVTLTQETAAVEAADHLVDYLKSPQGAELLEVAGFRSADLEPLPRDRGAGKLDLLPSSRPGVVATILRRWSLLTVPSRILTVFDVSGSMDALASGQTRASLAAGASGRALDIFPGQARIGVWAFSDDLGGASRDYTELVPTRRLDERVGTGSQREAVDRALADLPGLTDGGTGLYDTTLAAVRAVRSDYDHEAINTVVLLTDGENEDPGSISLPRLLRTLEQEGDSSRPVNVVGIGVGPDADGEALRRIVDATGGRSYIARDPADINEVFQEALLSR